MPTSPQLLLGLVPVAEPSLDNFVVGQNHELLHRLRHLASAPAAERFIHLWGESASGRSHLLRALTAPSGSLYCNAAGNTPVPLYQVGIHTYLIDDVERLDDDGSGRLFQLINQCREELDCSVVTSANAAPAQLQLREDLRTRLGWGLVFRIERLDDGDTQAALSAHARQIGVDLSEEVRHYLMTRFSRDIRHLTRLLDALDRYALAQHRAITVPLVRAYVDAQKIEPDAN